MYICTMTKFGKNVVILEFWLCKSLLLFIDIKILCTATKAKALQSEENTMSGNEQNVTTHSSQDREFIRFENEHYCLHVKILHC